mmetsp:Transcript_18315/g.55267  ORF Transcript_18315/g.55267 Transcript_18315/m.55267 type:complete len:206 (+) Transcript_18315:318-935(+)
MMSWMRVEETILEGRARRQAFMGTAFQGSCKARPAIHGLDPHRLCSGLAPDVFRNAAAADREVQAIPVARRVRRTSATRLEDGTDVPGRCRRVPEHRGDRMGLGRVVHRRLSPVVSGVGMEVVVSARLGRAGPRTASVVHQAVPHRCVASEHLRKLALDVRIILGRGMPAERRRDVDADDDLLHAGINVTRLVQCPRSLSQAIMV